MRLTSVMMAVLIGGLLCVPQTARGQQYSSSTGSQSGMFGSRSLGSGFNSSQSSSFGNSTGMGSQTGFGQSTTGNSMGLGSMTGGQSLYGQSNSVGASGFIGVSTNQMTGTGFIGAAHLNGGVGTGMNQGFGGNQASSYGSSMGRYGQGGGMYDNGMYGGGSYGNGMYGGGSYGNGMYGAQSATPSIRIRYTLGFDCPRSGGDQVNSVLAGRLTNLPALHWLSPCRIEFRGRTAILRGVVATEHDRDLAARVASLEAAIDRVENRIEIGSQSNSSTHSTSVH